MATIVSHAIVALAIGSVLSREKEPRKYYFFGMLCAIMPDLDAVGFWMGVPYDSMFGHRGFTHSFFFAFLLALIMMWIFFAENEFISKPYWRIWAYFFLATAMHPIVDAMTSGGPGVAFFSPFSNHRYFFPYRPIRVCSIGLSGMFSHRGLTIILSEFMWLWVPALALIGISVLIKRKHKGETTGS